MEPIEFGDGLDWELTMKEVVGSRMNLKFWYPLMIPFSVASKGGTIGQELIM